MNQFKFGTIGLIYLLLLFFNIESYAEDGYDLWMRYPYLQDQNLREEYISQLKNVVVPKADSYKPVRDELKNAFSSMLGKDMNFSSDFIKEESLWISDLENLPDSLKGISFFRNIQLDKEAYRIFSRTFMGKNCIFIIGGSPVGSLYGSFHFLRLLQMGEDISSVEVFESPKVKLRLLNHWDNLDRTVERGYAGFSIWDWHRLPEFTSQRYYDYARANASIGINGTVLTNVNANSLVLTTDYIRKAAVLADIFRPYGLKVYLTARFSSPIEIGGLNTADPLNEEVKNWWKEKVKEIYQMIPDFGGFLVKANSEGQPGPQDYQRSHAEGANMMADALEEFGGIVMWRAFVYSEAVPDDRAKQAYTEFKALDGKFRKNVIIQVKNGPIDFQPREPFHPLFGATPETQIGMEFQITQEYLGQGTHLVYLAPLFKECLDAETFAKGKGSEVSKVIDGSLYDKELSLMAGVSNIGTCRNWTGHHFGQANWYAFGRLAWDHQLNSDQISREWLKMTFSSTELFVKSISNLMMESREACVNYMTPMGLHHIMAQGHHYGPGPWVDNLRPDWTSVYYHQADQAGIGFDRTKNGRNAISQYFPELTEKYKDPATCPKEYILWFHHLDWDYKFLNSRTLWEEICLSYDKGVSSVEEMRRVWNQQEIHIDHQRFSEVKQLLSIQKKEAQWWRDACLTYFSFVSRLDFPEGIRPPEHELEYYMSLKFPYAPGIKPEW